MEDPECRYGYTREQVERIVPNLSEFGKWMRGQTAAICDGREYDYAAKTYVETGCGPHGVVTYAGDLRRFLSGGPILD